MAIARNQEDGYVKEMRKWEQRPVFVNGAYIEPIPVADGGRGGADRVEYPKMIYRAKSADGGPKISEFKVVQDSGQESVAVGQGWSVTQEQAIEAVHAQHREHAKLAANRAYHERGMSEAARAEAAAVDEATIEHVPVIPVTPVRKRRTKAEMLAAKS